MNFSSKTISMIAFGLLALASTAQEVNIWPDRVEPMVRLNEAIALARNELQKAEPDQAYCINATLRNGDDGAVSNGYWLIGMATELGNNYSIAIRMDRRVNVRKVREFNFKSSYTWPDRITPPIDVDAAFMEAQKVLASKGLHLHYCLNATLISGGRDVVKDGMWNFVFQSTTNDPKLVNVRMNGKTQLKNIDRITQQQVK